MNLRYALTLLTGLFITSGFLTGAMAAQPSSDTAGEFGLTVREGAAVPIELSWSPPGPADYFRVLRDGEEIAVTATAFCPDAPAKPEVTYLIEAWRDGQPVSRSEAIIFQAPDRPIREKTRLEAFAKRSGVRLSWPHSGNVDIVAWRVWREKAPAGGDRQEIGTLKASRGQRHILVDHPDAGRWIYTVAALNAAGSAGPEANTEATYDPAQKPELVLDWPLTGKPKDAAVMDQVVFTPDGAVFSGGYLQAAHDPAMDMDMGLTVEFEFRDESTANTPVLLSHGLWRGDGWFIQRLGGALVARTSVGDSPSFPTRQGRWYRVRMAYGGLGDTGAGGKPRGYMSLDGEITQDANGEPVMAFETEPELATAKIPAPVSLDRPLVIGQYNAPGADFAFRGTIRNLKIWDDYLENGVQ